MRKLKHRKLNLLVVTMVVLLMALSLPLSVCAEQPGIAVEDAAVAVATVVGVDQKNRLLTLKDSDGKEITFTVGPEVRNFNQIKRGDQVLAQYYSAFAIALRPEGSSVEDRTDDVVDLRSKAGEKPAVAISRTVTAGGVVEAIDKKHRTVTLKGAEQTIVVRVSDSVDLTQVKVGDGVDAVYASLYTVSVEPAPKVSGTVNIKTTSIAVGIGVEWGRGTMTMYDGSTYTFKINGLSVIDVGVSSVEAQGEVYHLVEAKDLEGTYMAGQAGATFIAGGSARTMKNSKGVVLKLKSTQKGLKFTLAPEGLTISDVK